jgi:CheY-like chemotaxis protein
MTKHDRLSKGLLKLGEIAELSGLSLGTIRHYSNIGLIKSDVRTDGNFRLFDKEKTIERLALIKKMTAQGKSLENILASIEHQTQPQKEVLIVDDEPIVCELIEGHLKNISVKTSIVHDGFAAGRMLGETVPDLVILDLHLPGIDGFEICKRIKQDIRLARTRILAITGYDTPENAQKILACGANAYLSKPFDMQELSSKIEELL